jgi:hypothetical protein
MSGIRTYNIRGDKIDRATDVSWLHVQSKKKTTVLYLKVQTIYENLSTRNLLVLNIGMKEIKFVGNKINLLVTEWHILFKRTILGWQFNTWSDAAVHLIL